jgi:hypothetical protein
MTKIAVGIRMDEELMDRLQNAIWHIGHGLTVTSVIAESLERAVKKLEAENGGKRFPRRGGELPKSPDPLQEPVQFDTAAFVPVEVLFRGPEANGAYDLSPRRDSLEPHAHQPVRAPVDWQHCPTAGPILSFPAIRGVAAPRGMAV